MYALPDLPYAYDALEPAISDRTLRFHHDHHHATYVKTLNELLGAKAGQGRPLEDVIRDAAGSGDKKLFNNAAQAWNHGFFWASMTAQHKDLADEGLKGAIDAAFGDFANFRKIFLTEAAGHFGSGWAWLVVDWGGKLSVRTTHDAEDPVTRQAVTPLIVCDLWEHAYYLDYQNDRKKFLEAWFDTIANWDFAARQHTGALGKGQVWKYPPPDSRAAQAA